MVTNISEEAAASNFTTQVTKIRMWVVCKETGHMKRGTKQVL
jgi:hypothetical protein